MIKTLIFSAALGAAFLLSAGASQAQEYPNKTVTFVLPYAPGGGSDSTVRLLSKKLTERLKQQFVVVNKPGVSGITGSASVAESAPDGYTLLFAADTTTSAPFMMKDLAVNLERDIVPITKVVVAPYVIIINSKTGVTDIKGMVAYAKAKPADFKWGVGGFGTPGHLAIVRFETAGGFTADKIPYPGEAGVVPAVMGGDVSAMLLSTIAARALEKGGPVTQLGITTLQPLDSFPGLPTVASQGFPGYEAVSWYGIWGPKGISPALTASIHKLVADATKEQEFLDFVNRSGLAVDVSKSPADFADYVSKLFASNGATIKALNLPQQ